MSITAVVENGCVRVPGNVPDGTPVLVTFTAETAGDSAIPPGSFFDEMRELIGSVRGPADWAAEHDHYIHGTPKRHLP